MSNWSLSVRVRKNNPDHHLFQNHGTWWCHFWAIKDGFRQERFRVNLHTKSRTKAHQKRNSLLRDGWKNVVSNSKEGVQNA